MADLLLDIPQKILFGLDTVNRLAAYVDSYGTRFLIVTESILYEQKIIERIQELLGRKSKESIVFDEVVPNATSSSVDDGVRLAKGAYIDAVIGLGGIKALCIAKCIAMTTPGEPDMDDYLSGTQPTCTPLPYLEIPTTCRNPFMLRDQYLMVDARDRRARIGGTQKGITKTVILDPKLSLTLPAKYTATTLLDTLLTAIEGFLSTRSNFLSETLFKGAIEHLGSVLKKGSAGLDELTSRVSIATAGLMVALGLTTCQAGLGTALSYAINGRFMVPKSWVASILIPHILDFNATVRAEKIVEIGALLGESMEEMPAGEAVSRTIESVRGTIGSLNLPTRLRDFDLDLAQMADIVEVAHSFDMIGFQPRTVSGEDIYDIIKAAF